ncbi:alpha/beta hydrolase [Aurantiacibacter poecillastricola]|uniref:alpha/beta hydrolase n=1 Tax=Aurantiacibacter poecillastricola TaxID=3064385 RepID=UPI00273D486F|nr:alpha/beta hydrolase [Aurantiacibacter sp. 219JJ12-13]MDP5261019.1 alpha/beta hydrolase [Aurantiacibacter sp. 219JJ12-13]
MKRVFAILAASCAVPAAAQSQTVIEEWVVIESSATRATSSTALEESSTIAAYGPFRVVDERTAALVGVTDARSPAHFVAMLEAFPAIDTLDFVEAPGTHDDRANLELGRAIRERGLATRAGEGGSVRSGAVELFLAGTTREIAPGSEFAVHGWLDDWGRGAEDYPADAPEHRRYLEYYMEMGMDEAHASRFYAMTNSVPFEDARWLTGAQMLDWLDEKPAKRIAKLDSVPVLQ